MTHRALKTYTARPADINKAWFLVDAKGLVLGRMAVAIARILCGKHKPTYTPHMDGGDNVIVINADQLILTGNKRRDKIYYRHTGYPGGIRQITAQGLFERGQSRRIVTLAVSRMLGRGPMSRQRLGNLKIYRNDSHPHAGVQAVPLEIATMNRKNTVSD